MNVINGRKFIYLFINSVAVEKEEIKLGITEEATSYHGTNVENKFKTVSEEIDLH